MIDTWHDHFELAPDGTIRGKTEIGRATVAALSMNDLWPRAARALQISAGWITEHA